jgi:hypothetical protein
MKQNSRKKKSVTKNMMKYMEEWRAMSTGEGVLKTHHFIPRRRESTGNIWRQGQ